MSLYQEYFDLALSLALEAGSIIKEAFYKEKEVNYKSNVDLVTETDLAVEELVLKKIRSTYPDHLFVGEESTAAGSCAEKLTEHPTWIVDPIDGTTNFVHRFPMSCISIAFAIGGQVVVGVVNNPMLGDLFTAIRGQGAFHNGRRLRVSQRDELKQALISTGFCLDRSEEVLQPIMNRTKRVLAACRDLRRGGSAALDMYEQQWGRCDPR
eukprot:TRINITY_DN1559_c0_g1_i10.p1 TRINITY_DN1559_c0_g1~~TRINITY_DN1559_c0_g1_i10.p1  ORF type:complete len:210 (+),score=30.81 TRINITY_DN1559_c0_g1_i10:130-759(+)